MMSTGKKHLNITGIDYLLKPVSDEKLQQALNEY